jgi:hypothetical protein
VVLKPGVENLVRKNADQLWRREFVHEYGVVEEGDPVGCHRFYRVGLPSFQPEEECSKEWMIQQERRARPLDTDRCGGLASHSVADASM